jgi:hypothetical protein
MEWMIKNIESKYPNVDVDALRNEVITNIIR